MNIHFVHPYPVKDNTPTNYTIIIHICNTDLPILTWYGVKHTLWYSFNDV